MGYLNPIESMGYDTFVAGARDAGVDGVLTVDLPPEEAANWPNRLRPPASPHFSAGPHQLQRTHPADRRLAQGYLYYVSLKGVTGSAALNVAEVPDKAGADSRLHRAAAGRRFRHQGPADRRRHRGSRRCRGGR
jgi:tryptophan synthase alpha chain